MKKWAELHLARSAGSQLQRRIWFILPAHGASYFIKQDIWTVKMTYDFGNGNVGKDEFS